MSENEDWADAATKAVGVWPGDLDSRRDRVAIHAKAVWFGIVKEFCPDIGLKDLSRLGGLRATAHSSCHACVVRWGRLRWRERHGWLLLAEGLCGPTHKRRIWQASSVSVKAIADARGVAAEVRERQTSKPFRRINIAGHYDER